MRSLLFTILSAVFITSCTSREHNALPTPASTLSVAAARTWYEATHELKSTNTPIDSSATTYKYDLDWSRAIALSSPQALVLIPFRGDTRRFAGRLVQGTRRLMITKESTNSSPTGLIIELLLQQSATSIDTVSLFTSFYHSYLTNSQPRTVPGTGMVLFYSADYYYQTGYRFTNNIVQPGTGRLAFQERTTSNAIARVGTASTNKVSSTNYTSPICTDIYQIMSDGTLLYVTSTGDCSNLPHPGDGGGVYGGQGDGGWGGNGGAGGNGGSGSGNNSGGTTGYDYIDPSIAFTPSTTNPPDVTEYNCSQLRNTHADDAIQHGSPATLAAFVRANDGLSRTEIVIQRGFQHIMPLANLPMGPRIRYIRDPLNPNVIIDLRHMLAVAYYGMGVGNSVEVMQATGNQPSAYDHQDYFSNELGYMFYDRYGSSIASEPSKFLQYFKEFLLDPSKRSRNSSPELIKKRCP